MEKCSNTCKYNGPVNSGFTYMLPIIIPARNNQSYLKCSALRTQRNPKVPYEIILHINDGSDGKLNRTKET